jgi:phage internal scaffolding protein
MQFRTAYNFQTEEPFATFNMEASMTQQSDMSDSDINIIMQRYGPTGMLPQLTTPGTYGDFTEVTNYRDALDAVRAADEMFQQIPAKIRTQFGNDAAAFLEFAENPQNHDELVKMGLATAPEKPDNPRTATTPLREQKETDNGQGPTRYSDDGPQLDDNRPRDTSRQAVPERRPGSSQPPPGDRGRTGR